MSSSRTFEIPDDRGLICGFFLHPEKVIEPLNWTTMTTALDSSEGLVWLHFNLIDSRARRWLMQCDRIPAEARDLFLANHPRIQLEVEGNCLFGVLGDLHYEFDADPDSLGVFRLYLDERCLITGRRLPLKALDQFRQEFVQDLSLDSSLHLMNHLLKHLTENFSSVIANLGDTVDEIEDQILRKRFREQGAALSRLRLLLVRLRRHVYADRQALIQIKTHLPNWCSQLDLPLLQEIIEWLDGVVQDLELTQERARLLQEEITSRFEEATNRNLYVLSIITTIFLPMTLVTGIFGMNVGGLPWTQDTFGFWWVMGSMMLTVLIAISVLRRQQLF